MDKTISHALWRFVRRDTSTEDFETWVYANEAALFAEWGMDMHLALLEMNYADRNQVENMRERFEDLLRPALTCECEAVANEDFILREVDRSDERFFASVEQVAKYGNEAWWLWLGKCRVCHTYWLIAQDEHHHDDYCVDRLPEALAEPGHQWAVKYRVYEAVLRTGRAHSKPYRFADRLSKSLVLSAQELRRDRPEIGEGEMADLLGIDVPHVRELFKKSTTLRESYLIAIFRGWLSRFSEERRP